jgi:hypothetical protein
MNAGSDNNHANAVPLLTVNQWLTPAKKAPPDGATFSAPRAHIMGSSMVGRNNWLPPCGAFARSTGLPCIRKPVLEHGRIKNGRCPSHGGKSTGPRTKQGHDRCTAGRIAYYAARRAAGLPVLPRAPKPAPRASPVSAWPTPTPAERRARAIRYLKGRGWLPPDYE